MIFQPFNPTGRAGRRRRLLELPILAIVPSLMTLSAMAFGMSAIKLSIEGRFELALSFLFISAALDGLDGRVARLLKRTSRFGAELDSLADVVNFGVTPAFILYFWGLNDLGNFGWMIAIIFAICAALRLARFNVALNEKDKAPWKANFFIGIPSPMAALIAPLPIYLELAGLPVPHHPLAMLFIGLFVLITGTMMVSNFPAYSGKSGKMRINRHQVVLLMIGLAFALWLIISWPWLSSSLLIGLYISALPFWYRLYRRYEDAEKAKDNSQEEG